MADFKPISNSAAAKSVIRREIRTYFKPQEYGTQSSLDAMKRDADAYNADSQYRTGYRAPSNYQKGAALVDAGALACYYDDQKKMLRKIYGKRVDDWSGEKTHATYKHLIGREYDAMLRERDKQKNAKSVSEVRSRKHTARGTK